jgi:hypothetical protein
MWIVVFWVVTHCNLADDYHILGGAYGVHVEDRSSGRHFPPKRCQPSARLDDDSSQKTLHKNFRLVT